MYRATSLISWCSRNSDPGSHFFCIPTSFLWEGLLPSIIFETKVGPLSCCSRISRGNGYHLHERVRHLQLQPTSYEEKGRRQACFLLSSKSKQTGIHAVARISIRNRYGKIYVLACESRALCVSSEQKHAVPIIVLRPQMPNTLTSSNNALLFHDHYRLPNKY